MTKSKEKIPKLEINEYHYNYNYNIPEQQFRSHYQKGVVQTQRTTKRYKPLNFFFDDDVRESKESTNGLGNEEEYLKRGESQKITFDNTNGSKNQKEVEVDLIRGDSPPVNYNKKFKNEKEVDELLRKGNNIFLIRGDSQSFRRDNSIRHNLSVENKKYKNENDEDFRREEENQNLRRGETQRSNPKRVAFGKISNISLDKEENERSKKKQNLEENEGESMEPMLVRSKKKQNLEENEGESMEP
ncbi:MAG: hypothetical protein MJ252_04700, partial [archaeon]|nr:hypothetical protein [archaeon]